MHITSDFSTSGIAAFLRALALRLKEDIRFDALLLTGSAAQGGFDEHSDLDLTLIVNERSHRELMIGRVSFAAQLGELLSAFTGEHVGEPRLLSCLYGPPLMHVDLKFLLATELTHLVEKPQVVWARDPTHVDQLLLRAEVGWPNRSAEWFEERTWIWIHYAATKFQRGELLEVVGMLGFFREQVLGPMFHRRAGRSQRGVRRMELIDQEAANRLVDTCAQWDRNAVSQALIAATTLYVELRRDDPPTRQTSGLPELLMPLFAVR